MRVFLYCCLFVYLYVRRVVVFVCPACCLRICLLPDCAWLGAYVCDYICLLVRSAVPSGLSNWLFSHFMLPGGNLLATGNQDTTTCVWDVRQPSSPLARMAGNMGAIRSLRFTSGACTT